jgi:hypothetical protein
MEDILEWMDDWTDENNTLAVGLQNFYCIVGQRALVMFLVLTSLLLKAQGHGVWSALLC